MDWAFIDGKNLFDGDVDVSFRCGSDIQSHSGKGAMGIRIDGTEPFVLDNIYIHDLVNWGALGSDQCGEYEEIEFEAGVDVDKDIQYGYTGNNVHGILTDYAVGAIHDIRIENLLSWYGSTHGIAVYKGSVVTFDGEFAIHNLIAGAKLTQMEVDALILPNAAPFVCSMFVGPNSEADIYPENTVSATLNENFAVTKADELYGYDYCEPTERLGDMIKPLSPEILELNQNKLIAETRWNSTVPFNAVMATTIVFVVVLCLKRRFCENKSMMEHLPKFETDYGSTL